MKEQEKEDLKKSREQQRLQQQKLKEFEKSNDNIKKEINKSNDKVSKENSKKNEKLRGQLRRDINNEIRKNRSEANNLVMEYYDNEEELEENNNIGRSNYAIKIDKDDKNNRKVNSLSEYISSLPSHNAFDQIDYNNTNDMNEKLLMLSNTLNLFRNKLSIESSIKLDAIVKDLHNVYIPTEAIITNDNKMNLEDDAEFDISNGNNQ